MPRRKRAENWAYLTNLLLLRGVIRIQAQQLEQKEKEPRIRPATTLLAKAVSAGVGAAIARVRARVICMAVQVVAVVIPVVAVPRGANPVARPILLPRAQQRRRMQAQPRRLTMQLVTYLRCVRSDDDKNRIMMSMGENYGPIKTHTLRLACEQNPYHVYIPSVPQVFPLFVVHRYYTLNSLFFFCFCILGRQTAGGLVSATHGNHALGHLCRGEGQRGSRRQVAPGEHPARNRVCIPPTEPGHVAQRNGKTNGILVLGLLPKHCCCTRERFSTSFSQRISVHVSECTAHDSSRTNLPFLIGPFQLPHTISLYICACFWHNR